ncbi:hypothetical protein P3342_008339 [Pyrenophora teres f. teres]|nr:hypothetical protein P3342_008339 [Pyrenophora teres f. teres]
MYVISNLVRPAQVPIRYAVNKTNAGYCDEQYSFSLTTTVSLAVAQSSNPEPNHPPPSWQEHQNNLTPITSFQTHLLRYRPSAFARLVSSSGGTNGSASAETT